MKFFIEAGGRFTGPRASRPVGAYLDNYGSPGERNVTQVLRSATLGAVATSLLTLKRGLAVENAIEAVPTKQLFRVPVEVTGDVQSVLGERFEELLAARTRAIKFRVENGDAPSDMRDEYESNNEYLNNPHRSAPIHVTNRGFVIDPCNRERGLAHDSLYDLDGPKLTREQRQFAVAQNFTFGGEYVPMRLSDLREPIVTGGPVPTVGTLERGEYVPKVVMHAESPNDWQSVTW